MLWGVQAGGGLGQSGVVSLPSEFPSRGSILQGDALQRTRASLGMLCRLLSRFISWADSCPSVFR